MLTSEPQLKRYYQRITQPVAPDHKITVDGKPIRFVGFERRLERAPALGEHKEPVPRELLGMTRERFDELVVEA